jgi:hypothetical protein
MPKGIKETSGLIAVSASVTESAANTFTSATVDLQLDPLNNEVFVVYAIDLDLEEGDNIDGVDTILRGSLSSTARTSVGSIADSNVMAMERINVNNQTTNSVVQTFSSETHPATQLEYLGILATNDFHLNIVGANQGAAKTMNARVYGARGRADSSIYAALVQSELLS